MQDGKMLVWDAFTTNKVCMYVIAVARDFVLPEAYEISCHVVHS